MSSTQSLPSHILAALVLPIALSAHTTWASPSHTPDPGRIVKGPLAARIDSFMTFAADLGLSGTLLVEKGGEVILHRGYGIIDRARRTPARTDTPYLLGSLSKQFTAAAAHKLESQGKLHLTDSLPEWFSNVPSDKRGITVDQPAGMTHTGFADEPSRWSAVDRGDVASAPAEACHSMALIRDHQR